jgi:hypothetical protein
MSYNVCLTEPTTGDVIELDAPHQMKGGTFECGGTTEAWLNDDVSNDYWEPTEGNVKYAILCLAAMAQARPDGVWTVT